MSLVFALVLLDCADDGSACERLAMPPESYASKALCLAHRDEALASDVAMKADYPTIVSRCLPHGVAAAANSKVRLAARGD